MNNLLDFSKLYPVDAVSERVVSESGKLEVFKHPCVDTGAKPVMVNAHSCHATPVRFSADGKYLFTVGGRDRLMLQWRVKNLS